MVKLDRQKVLYEPLTHAEGEEACRVFVGVHSRLKEIPETVIDEMLYILGGLDFQGRVKGKTWARYLALRPPEFDHVGDLDLSEYRVLQFLDYRFRRAEYGRRYRERRRQLTRA